MIDHEFERLLREGMKVEERPPADPLLMFEAREAVSRRRRSPARLREGISLFAAHVLPRPDLRHAGLAAMLVLSGILCFTDFSNSRSAEYNYVSSQNLSPAGSSTLSIISNTLLTSIPTLRQ